MNKKLLKISIVALLFSATTLSAQNVGINATGAAPDAGSLLDISSTNKGLLIPRVSIANLNAIAPITGSATTSMLVYNTNATTGLGYYYWDGAKWVNMSGDDWKITGNGNTVSGTNFLGTTNAQALDFRTSNTLRFRVANGFQVHAMNNGSETVPFYSWGADPNTGMWSDATDELNLGAGGVEFITLDEGGTDVLIFNEDSDNNFDVRMESANNQNMFFLDGSLNNIGIGTTPNGNNNTLTVLQSTNSGTASWFNTTANSNWVTVEVTSASTTQGTGVSGQAFIAVRGVTTNAGAGWAGFFTGDVGCTGTYFGSDRRWKKNINSLKEESVLDKLMLLEPKKYNFDAENFPGMGFDGSKLHFGFIAQDLEKVFPNIVTNDKPIPDPKSKRIPNTEVKTETGYYMVNYVELIPVLTQAIQEQQAIIESQNSRLDELEQLVKELLDKKQ